MSKSTMRDRNSTDWYDEYKAIEQQWMALKDQYSEIARELGMTKLGFWGDPLAHHNEIVQRAKFLVSLEKN